MHWMLCRKMIKVKVFRVTGEINKPKLKTPFAKEVVVDKPEHAVEKVYAEIGSKHRVKRFQIKIADVKEVPVEEIENPILKKIVAGE
jgi:large subunit ribosomal protein LX